MSETEVARFESSPLWKDVKKTLEKAKSYTPVSREVMIHTKDKDFKALKIIELSEKNDYAIDLGGTSHLRIAVGLGDYVADIYPYRDTLEITIKRIPSDPEAEVVTVKYRGVLDAKKNPPPPTATRAGQFNKESLNTSGIVELNIELIDRNYEVLRVATVSSHIYNGAKVKDLISGAMVGESNLYQIDGKPSIEAFNIVDPDNTTPISTCVFPTGLKIGNIPTFIQERSKGVYKYGLGTHFQRYNGKAAWWVYPLFDMSRFDQDVDRAVIFAVPPDRMAGIDRTFHKEGKILFIVAAGDQKYSDDAQLSDLNDGGGFRIANADAIMSKPAHIKDGNVKFDRTRLNTEIITRQRTDGLVNAPTKAPSSNLYKAYSELAERQGATLQLVWENSDPDLVYPGMPVKYVFMDKGDYRELKGTLLGRFSSSQLDGNLGTSTNFRTSTTLAMRVSYDE